MLNVVIPAAGEGTRLRPLSTNVSKAMVPVNGKPTIAYIIEQVRKLADVKEIVIVDGKFTDIREFVELRYDDVSCVNQGSLDGPRDAIAKGVAALKDPNLPLVVWLGDAIILDDDLPLGSDFVLTTKVDDHSAWCMYDGDKYYNKPKENIDNAEALVGLYSFSKGWDARHHFIKNQGYDISEAIDAYCKDFQSTTPRRMKSINTDQWYDIGELRTYYKTSAELLNRKSRAFNDFSYDSMLNIVTKKSFERPQTIAQEKNWYQCINEEQKLFTPKLYDRGPWLNLSYETGTLVSDLFMFGDLTEGTTKYIIDRTLDIVARYFHQEPCKIDDIIEINDNVESLWVHKSISRLKGHFDEDYEKLLIDMAKSAADNTIPVKCMHGDLHGGNILYNSSNDHITFIDPRGGFGNLLGCHGDALYDLAKLAHDFYHGYGEIVNEGQYNIYVRDSFVAALEERDLPVDFIVDLGALLMATCVELHSDKPGHQSLMIETVKSYIDEKHSH